MKISSLLFTLALLTACSSPSPDATTAASDAAAATPPPAVTAAAPAAASTAMSTSMPIADQAETMASPTAAAAGVVKAVDPVAKTITLDHGPVEALHWPAMIMTFKTGKVDVGSIKPGDHVAFEFASNGMDATLTKIDRR